MVGILECEQCGCASRGKAKGWAGFIGEDADGEESPYFAVFCPRCAAEEFGYRTETGQCYVCSWLPARP
jgi:hypothetical protein